MIKLLELLDDKILVPRRSKEERSKNQNIAIQKQIQQYIKDGSKGDLYLEDIPITSLPNNLISVEGELNLYRTPIKSLRNLTWVGGNFDLSNTPIESFGNLTSVGGNLYLRFTQIESLGNLESVRGSLFLDNSEIESLGNLTSVGGNLDLYGSKIKSLGNLTSVGGNLYLGSTPLSKKYTEDEIRLMVNVGGKIYL